MTKRRKQEPNKKLNITDDGWILATYLLPAPIFKHRSKLVLVYNDSYVKAYNIAWYDYHCGKWRNSSGILENVTHWRELPPPPNK